MTRPTDVTLAAPMQSPIIPGRSCENCTLCCKVMRIYELNKPNGVWCSHCKPSVGCTIYDNKPHSCSVFYCGYLSSSELDEKWKPAHSRLVISVDSDNKKIVVNVDQQRPDAWKHEPYYSQFKAWSRRATADRKQLLVQVNVGSRAYVVFPDRDVDLGVMAEGDTIITRQRMTPLGIQWGATKVHKGAPPPPAGDVALATIRDADFAPRLKGD